MTTVTDQARLSRLLDDLAAQGVTFRAEAGRVVVVGIDGEPWLDDWIKRHGDDLNGLLGRSR